MSDNHNSNSVYSGFTLSHPPSPLLKRILAYCVDMALISAIMYALLIPGIAIVVSITATITALKLPPLIEKILLVIGVIILICGILSISSFYFIRNELKSGATFGKKLFGLSVISIDGKKLNFKQCLFRDLMRIVDASLILPGFLSIVFTKQNKRLGDIVAGTIVIYIEKNAKENDFFYIKQDEFLLFNQILNPVTPTKTFIDEFLQFAFNNFILRKTDSEKADCFIKQVRDHFQSDLGHQIDRDTALLFFAELCHQTKVKQQYERNHVKQLEGTEYGSTNI